MTSPVGSFLLFFFACVTGMEDRIVMVNDIMGKSDFGVYKPALMCPMGKAITGFRVQVERPADEDKTGLTGIEMMCQDGTKLGPVASDLGQWGQWNYCDGSNQVNTPNYVTGFNYRYDEYTHENRDKDDRAGTQIKMTCSNGVSLGPEGVDFGEWYHLLDSGCPASSKFCGFAAQLHDKPPENDDDTGLNKMKFICCRPAPKLQAYDGWIPFGQEICIGSRNGDFGFLKLPSSGLLGAVKFVRTHGRVSCSEKHLSTVSNFGCNYRYFRYSFSIFVTTSRIDVTTRKDEQILPDHYHMLSRAYYTIIGKDGRTANNFTLVAANPTYINKDEEVRIWYGEDLFKHSHHDNGADKVCVNIYGKFVE